MGTNTPLTAHCTKALKWVSSFFELPIASLSIILNLHRTVPCGSRDGKPSVRRRTSFCLHPVDVSVDSSEHSVALVTMKVAVFWDMTTPYGSCKDVRFGGTYRLHFQGEGL
jgi:hypothetical protein